MFGIRNVPSGGAVANPVVKFSDNGMTSKSSTLIMIDGIIYATGDGETTHYYPTQSKEDMYGFRSLALQGQTGPIVSFQYNYGYAGALDSNGVLFTWGANANGQLGHGNTVPIGFGRAVKFFLDAGLTVLEFYIPREHDTAPTAGSMFAKASNGEWYSWGRNQFGQLGLGDLVDRNIPTLISALSGINIRYLDVVGVVYSSVFAVTDTNTLYSWGGNYQGVLGHGDTTARNTPTLVSGMSDVDKLLAHNDQPGTTQSCTILKTDGTVWGSGDNGTGELGVGDVADRSVFTQEITGLTNVVDIYHRAATAGSQFIKTADNNIYFTGYNAYAQSGMDSVANVNTFTLVDGDINLNKGESFNGNVDKVVRCGDEGLSTYAVLDLNGNVWTSGYGATGQRGVGDILSGNAANNEATGWVREWGKVSLPIGFGAVADIIGMGYAGTSGFIAQNASGQVCGWGSNSLGQLGIENDLTYGITPSHLRII